MSEEKKAVELKNEELEKVAGGDEFTKPIGSKEETDKAILENLTDNKGDDE